MASPDNRQSQGNNEPTPKKAKLATDYVCKALDCMVFRLVDHDPALPLAAPEFKADYAHQLFGETEEISGYAGLHIGVWMSAATAHTWVDVQYTQKRYISDDLDAVIEEAFSSRCARTQEEFKQLISNPAPDYASMGGKPVCEQSLPDGSEVVVQLYNLSTAPREIQALHARLEPLLLFFMDGASKIEADDPKWELLLALKKIGGKTHVAGFSTVYNYFHFPAGVRPRLSQVFVLPPYQGLGLGTAFVKTAYQLAKERGAPDLTIEDPSPELQTLRQRLELRTLEGLPWFGEQADKLVESVLQANGGADASSLQLPREVLKRVQAEEKIHAAECRQAWEAYLWQHPQLQGPKGRNQVLGAIKQRLHALHFSTVERNAVGKSIRDLSQDGSIFDMMRRPQKGKPAEGSGSASNGGGVSVGSGRNVSQVNAEEIEQALQLLLQEREMDLMRVTKMLPPVRTSK